MLSPYRTVSNTQVRTLVERARHIPEREGPDVGACIRGVEVEFCGLVRSTCLTVHIVSLFEAKRAFRRMDGHATPGQADGK